MNPRTTSIVAVMCLALGGGAGFVKMVSPALAERNKQQAENKALLAKAEGLNKEISELETVLNSMAMGSIQYFDISLEPNKKRIMEAKTVETLASISEIFNDNQIRVQALDPKGEQEGLNKPVPKTPTPSLSPGASPGAAPAAAAATPTPTPIPGATTPPPPIHLTHKMFRFEIEGEYPNLVKALKELQGLPRAISINDYTAKLVNTAKDVASRPQGGGGKKSPTSDSLSLIGLSFDLSITYLTDTGGIMLAPPSPTSVPATPHAAGFLAELGDFFCPPAYAAAAAGPRPAVKPPNAVKGVTWANGALTLQTANGSTPSYRVLGARPGFMAIELQRTVTTVPVFFHPAGPGVRQVVAMPSPTDPLATHLAISVDPGARMRLVMSPTRQLQIVVEGGHLAAKPSLVAGTAPVAAKPQAPVAKPQAPAAKPMPLAAKPQAPAVKPQAPAPAVVAAKPVVATPSAAQRPIVAILPPHRVPSAPAARTYANPATRDVVTEPMAGPSSSLKIVVKPNAAPAPAALEPEGDRVSAETIRAWERQRLSQTTAASAPLHTEHAPITVAAPVGARPQDPSLVAGEELAQTVVALPHLQPAAPKPLPAGPKPVQPAAKPLASKPEGAVAAKPQAPAAKPLPVAAKPVPVVAKPMPVAAKPQAPAPKPAAGLHQNAGVLIAAAPVPAQPKAPQPRLNAFAQRPAPKPNPVPTEHTVLDGARVNGDELVIATHGGTPSFTVLGGNSHLLLISVANMPVPGNGRLLPVGVNGVKQVRAALYDNRGHIAHLAIDTDGSVRLTPVADAAGNIRLRITGPHVSATATSQADVTTSAVTTTTELKAPVKPSAKPATKPQPKAVVPHPQPKARVVKAPKKPAAKKPVAAAPKPTGLAAPTPIGQPMSPTATPTPMAVPHGAMPEAKRPQNKPKVTFDTRHLEQTPSASYRFPLERDKATGRVNPFKPIPNPMASVAGLPPGDAEDGPKGKPAALPAVPPAPGGAPGGASKASEAGYKLQAVMIGGGSPPQALVSVGGHTLVVGLNQSLPGNVKVKSIQSDYVILTADGRTIRLNLKR